MNAGPATGLSTDQAPPLAIPLSFFVAPVGLSIAGVFLLSFGALCFSSRFVPQAAILTHLATLGFIGPVMIGALYQMIPVVAGAPLPWIRLAHTVHLALLLGLISLLLALAGAWPAAHSVAALSLGSAFVGFLAPASWALTRRATAKTASVRGMQLAMLALATTIAIGLQMVWARGGGRFVLGDYNDWLIAHVSIGLFGWVGGLITAIAWQVIPVFYLTPHYPKRWPTIGLALIAAGIILPVIAATIGFEVRIAAAPTVLLIGVIKPLTTIALLRKRRRKRVDRSLYFWYAGLAAGPLTAATAALAAFCDDPRFPILMGWLALFGWAGAIVHGMLTRIVPFLIWFHRYAHLVGRQPVPSMRQLLPPRYVGVGLFSHLATTALGVAAILTGNSLLIGLAGAGLIATGLALASELLRPLLHRPAKT